MCVRRCAASEQIRLQILHLWREPAPWEELEGPVEAEEESLPSPPLLPSSPLLSSELGEVGGRGLEGRSSLGERRRLLGEEEEEEVGSTMATPSPFPPLPT